MVLGLQTCGLTYVGCDACRALEDGPLFEILLVET